MCQHNLIPLLFHKKMTHFVVAGSVPKIENSPSESTFIYPTRLQDLLLAIVVMCRGVFQGLQEHFG